MKDITKIAPQGRGGMLGRDFLALFYDEGFTEEEIIIELARRRAQNAPRP